MLVALLAMVAAQGAEPLAFDHRAFDLDNGLRVVLHAEPRAPIVSIQLLVAAGARDDPPGLGGAAHLLEHALFTGSERLPGQGFDLELEALGGDANAWTHYDWTGFVTTVPPGALERALVLEADRLAAPSLEPAAVAVQQRVVLAEARGVQLTPHGLDALVLAHLLYPGEHPYGRGVMGIGGPRGAVDLGAVDASALRALYGAHYPPSRCVLAVAGDLDLDATEAWVRASFGEIPARSAEQRSVELVPMLDGERRAWLPADVGNASLLLGWRGVPMGHPDEPTYAMLAWLLVNDSPLWTDLVEGGLVTSLQAWSDSWQLGGGFVVQLSAGEGKLRPLQRAVDAELERLALEGPSPERLLRARGAWSNRWLRAADPVSGRASLMAQCVARGEAPDCGAAELDRYQAVGVVDIQRVAQSLLDASGRVVLAVAPEGERRRAPCRSERVVLP